MTTKDKVLIAMHKAAAARRLSDKVMAKRAEYRSVPSEAYMAGFAKAAEAYGVDPRMLVKEAQRIRGTVQGVAQGARSIADWVRGIFGKRPVTQHMRAQAVGKLPEFGKRLSSGGSIKPTKSIEELLTSTRIGGVGNKLPGTYPSDQLFRLAAARKGQFPIADYVNKRLWGTRLPSGYATAPEHEYALLERLIQRQPEYSGKAVPAGIPGISISRPS